ncbi:CDP-alcohol phosphatidyltransferase family protein [Candidatus Woesearchaeota archaeon]|nr:CDP-alcohol phosphatidyltransferase family protein [Candidatus Woesearchaeota archaeon]
MENKLVDRVKQACHPNRITASSVVLSAVGIGLMQSKYTDLVGIGMIGGGYLLDAVDGYVARRWEMQTIEGAKLDPLVDKVKNGIIGGYVAVNEIVIGNYFLPITMGANFIVDYISQKSRGGITKQFEEGYNAVVYPENCKTDKERKSAIRANRFGKIKTGIQTATALSYLGLEIYRNHAGPLPDVFEYNAGTVLGTALIGSAALGAIGVVKRIRNQKKLK